MKKIMAMTITHSMTKVAMTMMETRRTEQILTKCGQKMKVRHHALSLTQKWILSCENKETLDGIWLVEFKYMDDFSKEKQRRAQQMDRVAPGTV